MEFGRFKERERLYVKNERMEKCGSKPGTSCIRDFFSIPSKFTGQKIRNRIMPFYIAGHPLAFSTRPSLHGDSLHGDYLLAFLVYLRIPQTPSPR